MDRQLANRCKHFDPTASPIRTEARVVGVYYDITQREVADLAGVPLLNRGFAKCDIKESGQGPQHHSIWSTRWAFDGGSTRFSAQNFDVRFILVVSGSRSGDADFPITARPAYQPQLSAAFAYDIVCPSGYSSFQWYLQGLAPLDEGSARRHVCAHIARSINGTWLSPPALSDEREFGPEERFAEMPREWDAEHTGVAYPIVPGEALRVFFEYSVSSTDTNPNTRWRITFDAGLGFAFIP